MVFMRRGHFLAIFYGLTAMDALSGILGKGLWLDSAKPLAMGTAGHENMPNACYNQSDK